MHRRRLILLLVGCAVIAGTIVLLLARDREPRYQGKSLSQWLTVECEGELKEQLLITRPFPVYGGRVGDPKAEQAMHSIGTNALPWLVKWIASEPPAWRCNAYTQFCRLPFKLQPRVIKRLLAPRDPSLQRLVWGGFFVLTTNASPAVPDLVRLIHQSKPGSQTREWVISCLTSVGDAARPAITELMRDPDPVTSRRARDAGVFFDFIDAQRSGRLRKNSSEDAAPKPPYYLERPER